MIRKKGERVYVRAVRYQRDKEGRKNREVRRKGREGERTREGKKSGREMKEIGEEENNFFTRTPSSQYRYFKISKLSPPFHEKNPKFFEVLYLLLSERKREGRKSDYDFFLLHFFFALKTKLHIYFKSCCRLVCNQRRALI